MTERRAWLVVTLLTTGVALWLDFGTLHDFDHADSLIPVLVSTERWTPYFWGQDRYGMLVPLLAMPVHAPLANLLLQSWIMTTCALLAPFVIARFVAPSRTELWLAAGAMANLLLLTVTARVTQFDWLAVQPYALSLTLAFAGLIAAERRQPRGLAAGAALLTLAAWVNLGMAPLVAVAAVARRRSAVASALLVGAAALVGAGLARTLPPVHTPMSIALPSAWIAGWMELLRNAEGVIAHPIVCVVAITIVGATAVMLWKDGDPDRIGSAAAVPLAAGVAHWIAVGTSDWVRLNLYYPRYMFPTLVMVGVAAALVVAAAARRRGGVLAAAACVMVGVTAIALYGRPSLARLSRAIDARSGVLTPAVFETDAVAIAGDYWRVWPAVFHANLAAERMGMARRVFGLTYRSEVTDDFWCAPGRTVTVVAAADDDTAVAVAARHDISLVLRAERPPAAIYEARRAVHAEAAARSPLAAR